MTTQLREYPGGLGYKSLGCRSKQKLPLYGYGVKLAQSKVPAYSGQVDCPYMPDENENPKENCSTPIGLAEILNGERYQLVGQVVLKGQVQGVAVRSVFDEVIDDGAIDFKKLEARVRRLQSVFTRAEDSKSARSSSATTTSPARTRENEVYSQQDTIPALQDPMIFTITGCLTKLSSDSVEIDWFGGDKLSVIRKRMIGKWDRMNIGDWFKAVILRRPDGEVTQAILQNNILPPRYLCAAEVEEVYSKIKAAELTPMD